MYAPIFSAASSRPPDAAPADYVPLLASIMDGKE
jgi:hypothetical protein